jgi:hypothetical protein
LRKRKFPGSMHEELLVSLLPKLILPEGTTGALEVRGLSGHGNHEGSIKDLIVCFLWTWLEGSET